MHDGAGDRAASTDVHDLSAIVTSSDIRGVAGEQLTAAVAQALGAAFADHLDAGDLIVAHDMRVSSPALAAAFADGARLRGSTVAVAGLSATDQLYCASGLHDAAGAMITASHNPAADNGVKLCRAGARPVGRDTGLDAIRRGAEAYLRAGVVAERPGGRLEHVDTLADYVALMLRLVPVPARRPLRVVVDAANAMAALTVPAVTAHLDAVTVIPLHFELDGTFPHHAANPLDLTTLEELRAAVRREGADLGLAFDGDADRCVVVDETGAPVAPSAITALIATGEIARARAAGEEAPVVVANLVSSRHVGEAIAAAGGRHVRSAVGHSLIKDLMASHHAVFGGEHSAHYYFRDFFGADSGMLAALHVLAALEATDEPLSRLVALHHPYATSGEINSRVPDAAAARARVRQVVGSCPGVVIDDLDGMTVTHWGDDLPPAERWWFSLRSSHTEPLLRLNVEAAEEDTMTRVRDEVLGLVRSEDTPGTEDEAASLAARSGAPTAASAADVPAWVRAALRCPVCRGELRDAPSALTCTSCARTYPVSDGIPVLIPDHAEQPRD